MAPKKNDDSIPKKIRKRGDRGRTIMKSVIQERSRRNALLENTWNVNECHKSFVLSKAGTALNRHRHNLSIHVQNVRVEQPPNKYADIISKEDWLEFVKHCNDPAFLEISAANKVRGSRAGECPSRIGRKGYAKLEQEILSETQSEELSLPRHRLFRTARLDKNGRTNNPKALQIIRDIFALLSI
ncbi:hypothetical protein RIF29_19359 [Crotalaria pallida]|uniref:Uncharacterized protein n=1 Tax=Crotalaria pallida TaxID=3830 RepID=A0AAN9I429_CROPI